MAVTPSELSGKPLRVAVIGCGDVSLIHAEAIGAIEGAELVGVCDTDPTALARAEKFTGVPGFPGTTELISAVSPDVVHVTTPHFQHADPTITALEAGVHVLQEKPLAHTLAEGERIVAAAEAAASNGTKIGICFQNRYNVASVKAAELLADGAIGDLMGAFASVVWTRTPAYYADKPWRGSWGGSGGGLLINQAIHTLDLVEWLLGDVAEVDGRTSTRRYGAQIEVEDTAEALFTHASGLQTTFFATLTAPAARPVEIEITGTKGSILIRDGITLTTPDRTEHWDERKADSAGRSYWGVSHELLIRDFYAKLDDSEPFWLSPAAAMKPLFILKSLYDQSYGANHN